MADSARTHLEAINAHANLDLQEETAKQVGYQPQKKYKRLSAGLIICRLNLMIITIITIKNANRWCH